MTTAQAAHPPSPPSSPWQAYWRLYIPKLVIALREGYGAQDFMKDAAAGLTVAVVALPLAMALAIASGAKPEAGLVTVVVAGFLISALGGSRFQIGGPTGAFVVIVFGIVAKYGYADLVVATFMAGVILVAASLARVGAWIKYIPQPVVVGFTAGIAVIIAASQLQALFGLKSALPADFLDKMRAFAGRVAEVEPAALALGLATLGLVLALRRYAPQVPAFLVAIVAAAAAAALLHLPVATIGTEFGALPRFLPAPHLPELTLERMERLLPSALTIAFLAGLESLLSAMVADTMTGRRHRSHCELLAQGVANIGSSMFGGLPATGAIARTATNIRSGARTPVAGILHAVFVLAIMVVLAPLARFVPLAALAAVLLLVAWTMSEPHTVLRQLRGPWADRAVLVITFALTVLADLTVAIEVGVVLASILFMHRMAESVGFQTGVALVEPEVDDLAGPAPAPEPPPPAGVEAIRIRGPLFFGVTGRLFDVIDRIPVHAHAFIVRMSAVPMIDSSGAAALAEFVRRCRAKGIRVIVVGLQTQPARVLSEMRKTGPSGVIEVLPTYAAALAALEDAGRSRAP